jgi:hypothetical protein
MTIALPSVERIILKVRRQPSHRRLADYCLSEVSGLRWDYISGGTRRRTQWHVYGFVKCDGMLSGKLAHSCRHGPAPHKVKVCVTKKYNEKVWPLILKRVGPKPMPRRARRRLQRAGRPLAATNAAC